MSTEYKDKNGNSPEVGGFIKRPNSEYSAIVIEITGNVISVTGWSYCGDQNTIHANSYDIRRVIEDGYTFKPKPEEPKREIPKDGVPVKVNSGSNSTVFISAGKMDGDCLHVYIAGSFSGTTFSTKNWKLIK